MGRRRRCGGRGTGIAIAVATTLAALVPASGAFAAFPWPPSGGDPSDYSQYRLPSGADKAPNDLGGSNVWKFAATPDDAPGERAQQRRPVRARRRARRVARGRRRCATTAWRTTTGRPDVTIAVLDSGIKWNDRGAMVDLRRKTRLSKGESCSPRNDSVPHADRGGRQLRVATTAGASTPTATASSTSSTTPATTAWSRNPANGSRPERPARPPGRADRVHRRRRRRRQRLQGRHRRLGLPRRRQRPLRRRPVRPRHRRGARTRPRRPTTAGDSDLGACPNCMVDPHARRRLASSPTSTASRRRRSTRSTTACWWCRRRSAR